MRGSRTVLREAVREVPAVYSPMHWRLDVGFKEDEFRIRREQAGENSAVIRHIALNLLTEEACFKAGIKRKQKKQTAVTATFRKSLQGKGLRNLGLQGVLFENLKLITL